MDDDLTKDYSWRIVSNLEELLSLESEWRELFSSNPRHTPFQSWSWVTTWIKHLAGHHQLRIICLRGDRDELMFILPLILAGPEETGKAGEYFLVCGYGTECSDHIGALSAPALDQRLPELVSIAVEQHTSSKARVRLTSLDGVNDFPSKLFAKLKKDGRVVRLRSHHHCPTAQLPDSWDLFLRGLSKNFRSQVRRSCRNVDQHNSLRITSVIPDEATGFAEQLVQLNKSRIAEKGQQSSLSDPRFEAFLLEAIPKLADDGLAWMDILGDEEIVVAAALHLVHAERVYYYLGGFAASYARLRPGTVLFAEVIQRSISQGYASYDFLRGTESYKYRWGTDDLVTWRMDIYPHGLLRGMLPACIDELSTRLREALRRTRT